MRRRWGEKKKKKLIKKVKTPGFQEGFASSSSNHTFLTVFRLSQLPGCPNTLQKLWIVNFTSKRIPPLFFSIKHTRSALWWAETLLLLLGCRAPRCSGTYRAYTWRTALDNVRTQEVVAVLISPLGKSNQCKSSFFFFFSLFWTEVWNLYCLFSLLIISVLHSSEAGFETGDGWMSDYDDEDSDEKGMVHLQVFWEEVFWLSVTDTFYMEIYEKKIKKNKLILNCCVSFCSFFPKQCNVCFFINKIV